jgi:hypothetical protein
MNDIVKRLRELGKDSVGNYGIPICNVAADEIERLRADRDSWAEQADARVKDCVEYLAEIERLREISRPGSCECSTEDACRFARERDTARQEVERLRGTLIELRLRLNAAGRRPEECYEMSMIDEVIVGG